MESEGWMMPMRAKTQNPAVNQSSARIQKGASKEIGEKARPHPDDRSGQRIDVGEPALGGDPGPPERDRGGE